VNGYCTDANCTHPSGCACGGPRRHSSGGGWKPSSVKPSQPNQPSQPVTGPVTVSVEDTIHIGEPDKVEISGTGESDIQDIVKDREFVNWIDRVDLPEYALNLYKVLCIGGDGDQLFDILVDDKYMTLSQGGSGGKDKEAADVESVLTLVTQMDTPYSSGSGLFQSSQFAGGFDVLVTTAGDRAISYETLKEGDVVRTSAYNGIFVTKFRRDGNANYDADIKTATAYASTAFQAFDRDHPEVFWLNGSNKLRLVTVKMKDGEQTYNETYVFFLLVDDKGFTMRDSSYANQAAVEADLQRQEAAVAAILQTVTSQTPFEQVRQLNQWLTEHNEYNTSANLKSLPNWPHEGLSALVGSIGTKGPVCNGYSRAFKILCGRLDIPCVLVDGYARTGAQSQGEFHMWNSVQIGEQWFGVDVTWNDPTVKGGSAPKSGHENERFLLVGADTDVLGLKFSESHPPVNRAANGGVSFINGPTLSMAAFNPLTALSGLPFADVTVGSWYYKPVRYVYENDLMQGTGAAVFAPEQPMTRAMVWTILARLSGADTAGGSPWYVPAQSWAAAQGVSDGADPDGAITREQLVTMLWRASGSPDTAGSLDRFTDGGAVGGYAMDAMCWAVENEVISGMEDGSIQPQGAATRAQVAAILERTEKKKK